MYSVRLSRQQHFANGKPLSLDQLELINRSGHIPSISTSRRKSRRRDRHYAQDVINQSVFEWLRSSQKRPRQKRRSRGQSASPIRKLRSASRPTGRDSQSPIPAFRRSTTTTKTARKKSEKFHELYTSSFPTSINDGRNALQKDSLNKEYPPIQNIPQTLPMSPLIKGKQCSCQITMTYQSDTPLSELSHNARRDEVTILQEANNGNTFVAFKGFLKAGDKFTFKSHRLINDRFQLIIFINDFIDSRISSCCEAKYRDGDRIGGNDGLFWIQSIDGIQPCNKCHADTDTSYPTDNKNMFVSASSRTSSSVKLPMIKSASEAKVKVSSETESMTSESHADEFHGVDTTSKSTIQLSADNGSSSKESQKSAEKSKFKQPPSQSSIADEYEMAVIPTKASSPSTVTSEKKSGKGSEPNTPLSQKETTNDEMAFFQSLTTLIQQAMTQSESHTPIPERNIGNVENFSIAWIGAHKENDIVLLRRVVNYARFFNDIDELDTFLARCIDDKIIVILSNTKAQSLISRIHEVTCIDSIYLLANDGHQKSDWTNSYKKITGIYQTVESIRDHLSRVLLKASSTLIPITMTAADGTGDTPFTYYQLLKETMLCNDDESDLKKDLIEFCRLHYVNNPDELNNIDEFEKEFTPDKVIWWYTRDCFLSKVLHRAFRTQEIDLFYKMRYVMQCLHTQLNSIAMNEFTVVYVTVEMASKNALKLQENINRLLQFGAYLSAMLERPQSLDINEESEQTLIVFSINLRPGCGAKIEHLRSSDSTIDVLINIDTVFRILSVRKESNGYWNVSLESVNHTSQEFQQLTDSLRNEIKAPVVILQLTKLLLATDHYEECDYLAELLFTDGSLRADPTLLASMAAVHHLLGNVDDEKGNSKAAREQFTKSLRAFQSFLPDDHSLMSASYNNVGSMYFKDNEYDKAISFHRKALDCQLKSANPDTDSIATYSNNIGAVYFEKEEYDEALKHLQRAAVIMEKISSTDKTLNLCVVYQKIAACYWRMDKAKEALDYYEKTLAIQLALIPPRAHQLSVTYFNLSTAYARIGQIDDAVTSAEKSVEQLLKIYPPDHPEVKENQAQLEIVRQKKWLHQVLAS